MPEKGSDANMTDEQRKEAELKARYDVDDSKAEDIIAENTEPLEDDAGD
jgi:hypothetical protein